jgi:16S rRNA (guanine966-N2)-methyltransferase
MLHAYVEGARVLDLFAGAGSLGMEALSRGAKSCEFVEANRVCAGVIRENLKALQLDGGSVVQGDATRYCAREQGEYDLIFADPPYFKAAGDRDFAQELLGDESLARSLSSDGLLVVEVDVNHDPEVPAMWEQLDRRRYGSCVVLIIRKRGNGA